jgi:hypothetical protein
MAPIIWTVVGVLVVSILLIPQGTTAKLLGGLVKSTPTPPVGPVTPSPQSAVPQATVDWAKAFAEAGAKMGITLGPQTTAPKIVMEDVSDKRHGLMIAQELASAMIANKVPAADVRGLIDPILPKLIHYGNETKKEGDTAHE